MRPKKFFHQARGTKSTRRSAQMPRGKVSSISSRSTTHSASSVAFLSKISLVDKPRTKCRVRRHTRFVRNTLARFAEGRLRCKVRISLPLRISSGSQPSPSLRSRSRLKCFATRTNTSLPNLSQPPSPKSCDWFQTGCWESFLVILEAQ